jgi:hypothetical protein
MIIELMVYTTAISLILGLAALAIERVLVLAMWPRRWLWLACMTLSLGGSAILSQVTPVAPAPAPAAAIAGVVVASQGLALPRTAVPPPQRWSPTALIPSRPVLETYARRAWLATSVLLLGLYLLGALRLISARRRWPRQVLGRYTVLVSHNVGPAVFGALRPTIVVPHWLLEQPAARREAALLHEEQHVAAHDPGLLLAVLLLLALTAWNLPLWWQLHRLRLAIEVDCDGRVLRTGIERRHYLDTLLCINQHAGKMPLGAIASVGRASQLEQRVRAMTTGRPRHFRLWMAGWAAAAIPLLVVAAQLDPPLSAPASAAPHAHLGVAVGDFDVNAPATSIPHLEHRGALITLVHPGDVADRAGLKRGDVVVRYADTAIDRASALSAAVAHTPLDARVPLLVHRGTVDLKLTADFSAAQPSQPPSGGKPVEISDLDALRDANMAIARPQLRDELVRMARLDEMQQTYSSVAKMPPSANTGVIVKGLRIDPAETEANVRRLREIIARYGWPTVSMVGVRGATAAGMIANFANKDPGFQAQALALMEPLVRRDEVPTLYYAGLFDYVHTPQRFGTLLDCRQGVFVPSKPIEDPQHLEQRRAALGLVKLPQYCVMALDPPPQN